MKQDSTKALVGELAAQLQKMIGLQERLHEVIREKLEAMRRCDTEHMLSATGREGEIAAQISALNDRRTETAGRMCDALGIQRPPAVAPVTLRFLAGRLDSGFRQRLVELGDELRDCMLKVAEANRVVEMVSREMLAHFKDLFAAFTRAEDGPQTYSRGGAMEHATGTQVLDSVG